MIETTRRVWAEIDLEAFKKNLAVVSELSPNSKIFPVLKSNAYGHGVEPLAKSALESPARVTGFAVATIQEAIELHSLKLGRPILLMNGFVNKEELRLCMELKFEPVIHAYYQVEIALALMSLKPMDGAARFWVKMNSGMNRLGMSAEDCKKALFSFKSIPSLEIVFMTHLAYADDLDNPNSVSFTDKQLSRFMQAEETVAQEFDNKLEVSISASAGILTVPRAHRDYVRPGVMLYGSSPLAKRDGQDLGLHSVMTLSSRLISINKVLAGEAIGYNATFVCDRDMRVGTVSIGYGDGYPRSAGNGTPVLVKTSSRVIRTQVIGRVSMDMITIDLSEIHDAQIDDEIVLWGGELGADEVAANSDTIAYELFCKVTRRVPLTYV